MIDLAQVVRNPDAASGHAQEHVARILDTDPTFFERYLEYLIDFHQWNQGENLINFAERERRVRPERIQAARARVAARRHTSRIRRFIRWSWPRSVTQPSGDAAQITQTVIVTNQNGVNNTVELQPTQGTGEQGVQQPAQQQAQQGIVQQTETQQPAPPTALNTGVGPQGFNTSSSPAPFSLFGRAKTTASNTISGLSRLSMRRHCAQYSQQRPPPGESQPMELLPLPPLHPGTQSQRVRSDKRPSGQEIESHSDQQHSEHRERQNTAQQQDQGQQHQQEKHSDQEHTLVQNQEVGGQQHGPPQHGVQEELIRQEQIAIERSGWRSLVGSVLFGGPPPHNAPKFPGQQSSHPNAEDNV